MSNLRRVLLPSVLSGVLATLWLHLASLRAADGIPRTDGQPELSIDRPLWQDFDTDGRLARELAALSLEKWPGENRARLTEPQLQLVDGQQQRWWVQARLGWLDEDEQRLQLEQQVRLQREPQTGGLVVTTETLRIDERDGLIETDQAVVLTSGNWHFTATGLRAALGRQQLQLLGNVRGIHD